MITKFLAGLLVFACVGISGASDYIVNLSSNTATNDTAKKLITGRGVLKSVIIGTAGTTSSITLWDGFSSTVFVRKIGILDTLVSRTVDFDLAISSGLVYSTAGGAAANVTILYKKEQ